MGTFPFQVQEPTKRCIYVHVQLQVESLTALKMFFTKVLLFD